MSTTSCPTCRTAIDLTTPTRDGTVSCPACGREVTPSAADAATAAAAEPAPPQQFPVIPFTAPRGGPPFGLAVAAFLGLIAALVLGFGAALLRSYFWLVMVFPLLHGILVGLFAGLGARLTKARMRYGLGLVAGGCGVVSYFVVHFIFYLAFLSTPNAPQVGFWDFMDLRAKEGVRFGKPGGAAGNGIGYTGTFIYWGLEALITAVGAAGAAIACVGSPFCEGCNRWKAKRVIGPYTLEPGYAVAAVGSGVPAGLVAPADATKAVTVELYHCPHCVTEGTLDVKAVGTQQEGKNTRTWQVFVTYPGEALPAFEAAEEALRGSGLGRKKK